MSRFPVEVETCNLYTEEVQRARASITILDEVKGYLFEAYALHVHRDRIVTRRYERCGHGRGFHTVEVELKEVDPFVLVREIVLKNLTNQKVVFYLTGSV